MIRFAQRSQSTAPLVTSHEIPVADGHDMFSVRLDSVNAPGDNTKTTATTVVFANGFLENRSVLRQAVRGWLRAAHEDGQALTVATYDDPVVGKSAYGQDYRTERFAAALRAVADRAARPVVVGAHSRGWISAVEAAPGLLQEGLIASMGGVAVAGHCVPNMDTVERAASVARVFRDATGEVFASRSVIRDIGSAVMVANLFGVTVRHVACHLPSAIQEIKAIVGRNVTPQVAELSQRLPMRLAPCTYDAIFPGEIVVRNLEGVFSGDVSRFDARHGEPIVYPHWARPTYEVFTGNVQGVALAA